MRILRISNPYPNYLQQFYRARPSLVGAAYTEQWQQLEWDGFGGFGAWEHYMPPLGIEIREVAANVGSLQRAWAKEKGLEISDANWFEKVLLAQIAAFQPDILFMQEYATFSASFVRHLRRTFPCVKRIVVWCGAPYADSEVFKAYDAVFSCVPELVGDFQRQGHLAYLIDHGFDARVLARMPKEQNQDLGFTFVGQVVRRSGFHREREELLKRMLELPQFTIFSPSAELNMRAVLKHLVQSCGHRLRSAAQKLVNNIQLDQRIFPQTPPIFPVDLGLWWHMQPAVYGQAMYATLAQSRFTLNRHLDISLESASNMRLFEATGVGTCLLTDWKRDLGRFFAQDEIVTYSSVDECLSKARWLFDNPNEAKKIGERAQARTLREHSYAVRIPETLTALRKLLNREEKRTRLTTD